jgi:hypothetical protein
MVRFNFIMFSMTSLGTNPAPDVIIHARLVTGVIKSKTFNISTSQMFSNTSTLLAIHQYSMSWTHGDTIDSFLRALDEALAFYQDSLRYHGLSLARNCWFCQAMYVLASCRPEAFSERLRKSLCTEFLKEVTPENSQYSGVEEHLPDNTNLGDTWALFNQLSRRLGTQPFEWTCPGFMVWPDRSAVMTASSNH